MMFDENYEVVVADTPSSRYIHHRIRYQVYCVEEAFEDPGRYPDGQEQDAWDDNAVHFIVRDRHCGEWIGAMRLIKPANRTLPIQRIAQIDGSKLPPDLVPGRAWELSRICILRERRRSMNRWSSAYCATALSGGISTTPVRSHDDRRQSIDWGAMSRLRTALRAGSKTGFTGAALGLRQRVNGSEVLAGMLRAAIEYARDSDYEVRYFYFLINPAMARMVGKMQFDICRIGDVCKHRGIRYPYFGALDEAVYGAVMRSPEMAQLFLHGDDSYRFYSAMQPNAIMEQQNVSAA